MFIRNPDNPPRHHYAIKKTTLSCIDGNGQRGDAEKSAFLRCCDGSGIIHILAHVGTFVDP